jgi:membrane protease YdiL (CAAX protease family)
VEDWVELLGYELRFLRGPDNQLLKARRSRIPNPWLFFALAVGISWFFWSMNILGGWDIWTYPAIAYASLGMLGPALAGTILIARSRNDLQRIDFWRRVLQLKRVGGRWLAILLIVPGLSALAILASAAAGASWPGFETIRGLLAEPWRIPLYCLFVLVFGPIPEELGWRGYALDGLQARFNPLVSSIILGMMWAVWRLPIFLVRGTYQHNHIGFATPGFLANCLCVIAISVMFTWIYNRTQRSTLSAILFHFVINLSAEIFPLAGPARWIYLFLLIVTAIIMIATEKDMQWLKVRGNYFVPS